MSSTGVVRQFLLFALVGVAGFVVDAGTLLLVHHSAGVNLYVGRLISFLVAATFTWHLNRKLTFREYGPDAALKQWAKFLSANALGALVNLGVYAVLIAQVRLARAHPELAVACGSVAGLFFNFTASRLLVFRAHLVTVPRA